MLTVIIPAYNEEDMIDLAAKTVGEVLAKAGIPHEILFVDDGSKDATWEKIQNISGTNASVRGIRFSRNFGKESAIYAGLCEAAGSDCAAVMDCDLQHPPAKLVEMYRLWEQGYEVVEGVKNSRGKESPIYHMEAKAFYRLMSDATGIDMSRASDFKLLDRKAVLVLVNMRERNAFFRALSSWIGFNTAQVSYDVEERRAGATKWTKAKLLRYGFRNVASFTSAPLQLVTVMGAVMLLVSIPLALEALITWLRGASKAGFTTVILFQAITGSMLMISLGLIGYYISLIYDEVKGRPKFIINEITAAEKTAADRMEKGSGE